ncbi:Exopolyphosphatase [Sporothrix eucalyptigena]|uniref:Exopolyphosphatase n=1 Tax=Sporothrix eucalyptigena TaxID=1812306 RepID=A0ABP0CDC1_9PEZI
MPPRSLGAFLKAARSALTAPASQRPKPLTIVVGNESADLDSLCSAILLAYFRSHTPPHNASVHVPLCNLDRGDLALRPELQAALSDSKSKSSSSSNLQGVPLDSLITLTELPDDLVAADTRWLLVDHNALTGDLAKRFQKSVVGCIDHHVDERVVPSLVEKGEYPRVIETCGSCASLVVDYAKDAWHQLAEQEPDEATDHILARLALAPILVDTSNLKNASKTADVDKQSVSVAESVLGTVGILEERSAFFDELSRLKNDLTQFTYRDILRKDYKQWQEKTSSYADLTAGFSSVVQGMGYLLDNIGDREALFNGLKKHAQERNLDIAAVMTVQHDEGGFARQLLLWAFNEQAVKATNAFIETYREKLDLKPWGDGLLDDMATEGEWRTCWTHGTQFSRKQVAPLLREAMKSV